MKLIGYLAPTLVRSIIEGENQIKRGYNII